VDDPRGHEVLKRTAERFGWRAGIAGARRKTGNGKATGQGLSYVHYKHKEAYVALAVEVEVDRVSGAIRVTRAVCGQDCGLLVNPDGARAQVEGGIIQTISRTLKEEVTFDRSRVTSLDWASYPLLTFPEVPAIEVVLVNRPEQPPLGIGEPMTTTVAGAIANAVFDATGVRLRTVPFTPERVQAALAASQRA
jgi:CO/xanthine dehydrogenase Mo-binding subunit